MTQNQAQDIRQSTFVLEAEELIARFNDLDVQFLCTLRGTKPPTTPNN
ncbi:MAG: hypothetical protein KGY41_09615 [Desulfovermiculus sp.]|nr:hypothetical protein [Desulfovermiculus sp.]